MIKAVIFDLDDTLDDYHSASIEARKAMGELAFQKYGIEREDFIEAYGSLSNFFVGHSPKPQDIKREMWFYEIFRMLGVPAKEEDIYEMENIYWDTIHKNLKVIKGVKPTLEKLREQFKLVILTDSDGYRDIKIGRIRLIGLYQLFDLIVTTDDTGVNKPDPKNYDYICGKIRLKPDEIVMVGDKPEVDLEGAKRFGMHTIWFKHGLWAKDREGADFDYVDAQTSDFEDIPSIIQRFR